MWTPQGQLEEAEEELNRRGQMIKQLSAALMATLAHLDTDVQGCDCDECQAVRRANAALTEAKQAGYDWDDQP